MIEYYVIILTGLIFDLDGTLVDTSQDITDSVNYTLKNLGSPHITKNEVERYIGDGMRTLLIRATGNEDSAFIRKAIDIFRPHYLDHCVDKSVLYPGVREVLERFKSKPMALVTNKPTEMVAKILDHFGVRDSFRAVLGAESTKEKKPHPEPILKSLESMGTQAQTCMIVGDGNNDIEAGKAAGTLTCAVTYGFRKREELERSRPDFFIHRITDLNTIVS